MRVNESSTKIISRDVDGMSIWMLCYLARALAQLYQEYGVVRYSIVQWSPCHQQTAVGPGDKRYRVAAEAARHVSAALGSVEVTSTEPIGTISVQLSLKFEV